MSGNSPRLRQAAIADALSAAGLAAAVFLDDEAHRDPGLRWLCGLPADGVLVITADGTSALAAWDVILAERLAQADRILPYTDYGRTPASFLQRILPELGVPGAAAVELPPSLTWLEHARLSTVLSGWELSCGQAGGAHEHVGSLRAVKDEGEIETYRRACALTDRLLDELEEGLAGGGLSTEADVALWVERRCRELGAEGTGFETLAAGPGRSWGIHAFPAWGAGPFGAKGLSIIDFGIRLEGYVTDVTLGVSRGPLDRLQEEMVELVRAATVAAVAACAPACSAREPARACDEVFSSSGWKMPHSLGHGIGLEAHERPYLRNREDNEERILPGMIFTIEPGLYHPELGGIRLENDWLMTEGGPERLTSSRILRL